MKLVKQPITVPTTFSITAEAEEARNEVALRGMAVKVVTSGEQNEVAGSVVRDIRAYVKSVEAMRVTLTKPLLEGQRLLKALSDDHCAPLAAEQQRIERLAVDFAKAEARRVAEEERKRHEAYMAAEQARLDAERRAREAAELAAEMDTKRSAKAAEKLEAVAVAAEAKVQEIIAAPMPEVARSRGQQTRRELRVEVTDIRALAAARPDLVKMEPNLVGIKATLVPESPNMPPGLKLWWEDKVVFSSSRHF